MAHPQCDSSIARRGRRQRPETGPGRVVKGRELPALWQAMLGSTLPFQASPSVLCSSMQKCLPRMRHTHTHTHTRKHTHHTHTTPRTPSTDQTPHCASYRGNRWVICPKAHQDPTATPATARAEPPTHNTHTHTPQHPHLQMQMLRRHRHMLMLML